jgi:hypothetical protein
MAIINPPARLPLRSVRWRCPEPAIVNRSGWTGTSKVVGLPGAGLWSATGTFTTIMREDRAARWRGFFLALRGQRNSFPLVAIERARQTSIANPTVSTGATAGDRLPLEGLPPNRLILRAGELITVPLPSDHQRLVGLTEDLISDANGRAAASIAPELGETPRFGVTVIIDVPFALVRQTSEPPGWDVDVGQTYAFALTVEEAK